MRAEAIQKKMKENQNKGISEEKNLEYKEKEKRKQEAERAMILSGGNTSTNKLDWN